MISMIDEFQKHAPEGCLKYQNRDEHTYFYHQYMDENKKQWKRKYIKRDNISLVKALAQKHYYMVIRPVLEKELKELENLIKQYHPQDSCKIYDALSDERKKLISSLQSSREEQIRKWSEENYEKNNSYPENLRFETEQGELVRSKSEVIIANILNQHKSDILYKYERPLELVIDRKIKTIFPDFTLLNVHTGRVI